MDHRFRILPLVLSLLACAVAGCGISNEHIKPGVTDAQRHADLEECWKFVHSEEGQRQVNQLRGLSVAGAVLGGGIIAGVAAGAATATVDSRKDGNSIAVHSDCMRTKGYKPQLKTNQND